METLPGGTIANPVTHRGHSEARADFGLTPRATWTIELATEELAILFAYILGVQDAVRDDAEDE